MRNSCFCISTTYLHPFSNNLPKRFNMLASIFFMLMLDKKILKISRISIYSFIFLFSSYSTTLATDKQEVYKFRMNVNLLAGSADRWNLNGKEASEEWVVIKVKNKKEFKIYHTTYLENKTWKSRQWFDHPVTEMRICTIDGFEKKDCKVVNSDTTTIPDGLELHDLSIDFKYSESGRSFTKNITVSRDVRPE